MSAPSDGDSFATRRGVLRAGAAASLALALGRRLPAAEAELPLIRKPIPSTREMLPVIGLGTNNFDVTDPQGVAARREVLQVMPQLGGSVVDTAPLYGRSEEVIGSIVADLGNRDRLFLATKVTAADPDASDGKASLQRSLERLRTARIDLMQIHNLMGVEALMPVLREWKQAGRIRYIGVTTSDPGSHPRMLEILRRHSLDFIQVDYSLGNRAVAEEILPLAQQRGVGVLINVPFGGRRGANLLSQAGGRPLPQWAADFDAHSWAQFLLKYVVSHPAVVCAIPGTTQVKHLRDNQAAGRSRLPETAERRRMEQYWDSLK